MKHGFTHAAQIHLPLWTRCTGRSTFSLMICDTPVSFLSVYLLRLFCPTQIVWTLDQVTLLNPPEEPVPDHLLDVLYSCNGPAAVQLDCVVSFETGITSTTLLRRWSCVPGHLKVKTLALNLPDWLVYRADGIVPDSRRVLSCVLLASVRYGGFDDTEESLAAQDAATLQPKGFFGRPMKRHQLCVPWSTEMLRITQLFSKKQCPMERGRG